LILAMLVTL